MHRSGIDQKKTGDRDALRRRKAFFGFLFVAVWIKSMASGGTRPAGLNFNGGELLHVAGNFLPSTEWAGINVGRFCRG
jgi:hypothetical protein